MFSFTFAHSFVPFHFSLLVLCALFCIVNVRTFRAHCCFRYRFFFFREKKELCVCASHKCFYILLFLFHFHRTVSLHAHVFSFVLRCCLFRIISCEYGFIFCVVGCVLKRKQRLSEHSLAWGSFSFEKKNQRNMPLAIDERKPLPVEMHTHKTRRHSTTTATSKAHISHTFACRYTQFNGRI